MPTAETDLGFLKEVSFFSPFLLKKDQTYLLKFPKNSWSDRNQTWIIST